MAGIKRRSRNYITDAACAIFLLLTCLAAPALGHNGDILVLQSYHEGHPCSDNPMKGIRDIFRENKPGNDIHVEYLDAKRFAGDQYYDDLFRFYRNKYGRTRFEVIISSDDNAFRFLLKYGDRLFPGVPVVFCGLNYYAEKMLAGRRELFTGVVEATDTKKTVDIAIKLHPQTRKIVVVNDRTETGEANRRAILDIIPEYKGRVEFVFHDDLIVADLLNEAKKLSSDSVILFLTCSQDKFGASIEQFEFLKQLSGISPVPVYGLWDVSLGYGIVGGMLTSGYDQGKIAAEMAVRILNGEKPGNIPVVTRVQNNYAFDFNQLKRFRISMHDLPEGSRIHNKPVTVYEQYKAYFLTAIAIIAVLVTFIILLILNVVRRRFAEDTLHNVFKNMGEGLAVIDGDFRIVAANGFYCNLHDTSPTDVVGKRCHEIVLGLDKPCDEVGKTCPVRHSFATGESLTKTDIVTGKNGAHRHVEVTSYPISDDDGRITSVVEITRDVTERKKLEDQLRLAQKMEAIGTLAGGIAHDFNNILTAIMGYANLLQMEVADDDPMMNDLDSIVAAVNKAASLTDSLLAYSRREAIDPSPVDLNRIVDKVDILLSRLIRKDIETVIELADEKLTIMADAGQIEQVLMNFATNARDAMPGGGHLLIGTGTVEMDDDFIRAHGFGEVGRYALLSVSDTGKGMDEKTRERIFEPFFTTKERGKGTGLGLSVVYGIVKQHNGYINVYSEPDHGTVFNVYIPLSELAEEEMKTAKRLPARRGTGTILLAEDRVEVRQMLRDTLVRFGYRVLEAVDGEDAVTIYGQNKGEIRLLIIDIVMPKKNGKEVYEEIRKTDPAMKAIFMSGYTADIVNKKGIAAEGQNFLSKPFTPNKLLAKIREVLEN